MDMRFTKMHGLGNDYIYIDLCSSNAECLLQLNEKRMRQFVKAVCDRHTGIGADGVILIETSLPEPLDGRMHMWNADGSKGAVCGNGLRCVAAYLWERKHIQKKQLYIQTDAGSYRVWCCLWEEQKRIRVDMGACHIGVTYPLLWKEKTIELTTADMGNKHGIVFVSDLNTFPITQLGNYLNHHIQFPDGLNVEVAEIKKTGKIAMRVFERGSGETKACGTGACAVCAVAVKKHFFHYEENIDIEMPGGCLRVMLTADERVIMEGPAAFVFDGQLHFSDFMKKTDIFCQNMI